MTAQYLPILYSFRRCPYAMRARMALLASGLEVEHREVELARKPDAMLKASPKGTVPVLIDTDGRVIDESLNIMEWALSQHDLLGWRAELQAHGKEGSRVIEIMDSSFKHHLDRYKYAGRYKNDAQADESSVHRQSALEILEAIDPILSRQAFLLSENQSVADVATFPFVRQFANADRPWFDAQAISGVHRWLTWHLESDLFVRCMTKHKRWQPD